MRTNPVDHKFGHPKPYPVSFGILKGFKKTLYGQYTWGTYKNYRILIKDDKMYDQKLIYVTDNKLSKWVKSKLIYIQDGVKKVMRSQAK